MWRPLVVCLGRGWKPWVIFECGDPFLTMVCPYLLPLTVTLIVTVAIRLGNLKIVSVTVTMSVNVMKPMCGPKAKMMCVCDRVLIGQK